MAESTNSILQKLDGLEARFEEVSTLITDPDVIADQNRFVKLTKEYKDLGDIMDARKRYIACLNNIKEAKDILAYEDDPEMKEMAREELTLNEALQPQLEEEIKIALIPKDPEDANSATPKAGNSPSPAFQKVPWEDIRRLTSLSVAPTSTAH